MSGKIVLSQILLISALALYIEGCQNAIPQVSSIDGGLSSTKVGAKSGKYFSQVNAGSQKAVTGNYKVNSRMSQAVAQLKANSQDGYKLQGTVSLQK